MSKRDHYVEKMKLQLDEMNQEITALEAKASEASQEARERYELEMAKLHAHSKAAVAQMETIRASGEDSWHKLVADMENTRKAFVDSFHYFKSRV
jgi:molecular chaperone GrpE (heat shock protein)